MKPKHIFFDMDGTLTKSRTKISKEMETELLRLSETKDIAIVSGATKEQIEKQIGGELYEVVSILAQNGNQAFNSVGSLLWNNEMSLAQAEAVLNLIEKMGGELGSEFVQDRGCQISYSAVGHNAPLEKKLAYDPDRVIRSTQIEIFSLDIWELNKLGVKVAIGGTTCLDFYLHTKGFNVEHLIKEAEWKRSDCMYVGDALFPGGNDESVMSVISYLATTGPELTLQIIRDIIG